LGVKPSASRSDIQSSYRRLSLKYHPDRNKEQQAAGLFEGIKKAQELLTNEQKRRSYDRFADLSPAGDVNERDPNTFAELLVLALLHVVFSLVFGFLYTAGSGGGGPREIFTFYIAFAFLLEVVLWFSPDSGLGFSGVPILGGLAPFELIRVVQRLTPFVLNGVLLLQPVMASQPDSLKAVATFILESNLEIINKLQEIRNSLPQESIGSNDEGVDLGGNRGTSAIQDDDSTDLDRPGALWPGATSGGTGPSLTGDDAAFGDILEWKETSAQATRQLLDDSARSSKRADQLSAMVSTVIFVIVVARSFI